MEIKLDSNSHIPKYKQIIESILLAIKEERLVKGDKIASIGILCKHYKISQDTVLMAYNELKFRGIITSSVGKGYYVTGGSTEVTHNVFLFFDKLTAYKETLYDAFKNAFQGKGKVQIFFHFNNPKVFKSLIESVIGEFTDFVIMPVTEKNTIDTLSLLPRGKTIILDRGKKQFKNSYPYICQDFERDIYLILRQNEPLIKTFSRMILILHDQRDHLKDIARGFKDFCKQLPVKHEIINNVHEIQMCEGDVYIVVDDNDLIKIVKATQVNNLQLGKHIGLISYNETPLKEIIAGGITTISTDFVQMGQSMANMILTGKKDKIDNPFIMIRRNSF